MSAAKSIFAVIVILVLSGCIEPEKAGGNSVSGYELDSGKVVGGKFNVILISVDTLRSDSVGAYGYGRSTTPNIDKLALDGVVFENYYSNAPFTPVSHASVLTSLYPETHGMKPDRKIRNDAKTWAEYFRDNNYSTAGIVNTVWLYPQFGFSRGFDSYDTDTRRKSDEESTGAVILTTRRYMSSEYVNGKAIEWLDANSDKGSFFLFVHYYDVHSDGPLTLYYSPKPYSEMFYPEYDGNLYKCFLRKECYEEYPHPFSDSPVEEKKNFDYIKANYDSGIAYTDNQLGIFFQKLKDLNLYDSSMIILISDHGEEFYEHNQWNHQQLYKESLHVPLAIKFPNSEHAGKRVKSLSQGIDVLPTVLDYFGIEGKGMQGKSLLPLVNGKEIDGSGLVFSSNTRRIPLSFDKSFFTRNKAVLANANDADKLEKKPTLAPMFRSDLNILFPDANLFYSRGFFSDLNSVQFPEKSLIYGKWEYIMRFREEGKDELYNIEIDLLETTNLIDAEPDAAKGMREKLMQIYSSQRMPDSNAGIMPLDKDALEELRALGYVN